LPERIFQSVFDGYSSVRPISEMKVLYRIFVGWLLVFATGVGVAAAQDVLSEARNAPTRTEGLAVLEKHLSESPRDVDARLLYGLMLSWEGRYDDARRELRRVLEQTPTYTDARVALMNVEWWSNHLPAAREQVDFILSRDPGNTQARLMRQRLDASSQPWTLSTSVAYDRFSDGRDAWNEQFLSLSRQTMAGSIIFRAAHADRFGFSDQQFELEFYPTIRAGTYGFVAIGVAPEHDLYPLHRIAFDLYQSVGRGFEVSGGYRRLEFGETTSIYVGTITKYVGNWMLTGKVFHVPGEGPLDSTSGHAVVRRYFGGDGTSFVGASYSQGLSREEVRGVGDLLTLDSNTVRGQLDATLTPRLRLQLDASTSRQERSVASPLWQTSFGAGFSIRF
jgi:YaiO family outer membrane protein